MKFTLFPVLDHMIELYQQPAGASRFEAYLALLQGSTVGDLAVPVSGFNPMAKPHVLQILLQLREMGAEELIRSELEILNKCLPGDGKALKMAFNLGDDLKGGWTNRYVSDYQSKFRIGAFLKRCFCVPMLWTSEAITEKVLRRRVHEYAYRSLYALDRAKPVTLADHVNQEVFVAQNTDNGYPPGEYVEGTARMYEKLSMSKSESEIIDFFYGDPAALAMGRKAPGLPEEFAGFRYVSWLVSKSKGG